MACRLEVAARDAPPTQAPHHPHRFAHNGLGHFARAFRAIDEARSLSEILDALTASAGRQATRAALILVRGADLRTWRSTGPGATDVAQQIESAGIVRDAVRSRSTVSADAASDPPSAAPEFAATHPIDDRLAVPLLVGGEIVAVLYADRDAEDRRTPPGSWRSSIELMTRHAARSLEVVTAFRTTELFVGGGGRGPAPAVRAGSLSSVDR